MTTTDDELAAKRHAADANLHAAITLHASAYHLDDDDHMLNEYIIVSSWVRDDDGAQTYVIGVSHEGMAEHVALGLLAVGTRKLSQ